MLQLNLADTMPQEQAPIVTGKRRARTGKDQLARFMTPAVYWMQGRTGSTHLWFLYRRLTGGFGFGSLDMTAYEVDDRLRDHLDRRLAGYSPAPARVIPGDDIRRCRPPTAPP